MRKEVFLGKKLLVASFIAFLVGLSIGLAPHILVAKQNNELPQGAIIPVLEIKVFDQNGKLIKAYTKVGDPPTFNFIKIVLQHNLWGCSTTNKNLYNTSVVNDAGTAVGVGSASGPGARFYVEATVAGVANQQMKIKIGSGTTAFSPSQYNLQGTWIQDVLMNTFVSYYNSTHMWSVFQGTWTNTGTSSVTVTEAGLFIYWVYSSSSYAWFMLFRDVFSAVTVPSNGAITITYTIYVRYA
ncbi:MAG: hypothetical protein ACP5IT_11235 [Thermoproteota archaeon]